MKTFAKSRGAVGSSAIVAAVLILIAGPAAALEVCLKATPFDKTYADGGTGMTVPMWGYEEYAYDTAAAPGDCDWSALSSGPSVPGPGISVPVGDATLNIHLLNGLPAGTPTSLVIVGQNLPAGSVPVRENGRIRSAVSETASGTVGTYSWANLAPGTYLYRTGTHPQVQQQMGLYGALTHDSGVGEAYPGVFYLNDAVLLYSEIDPALHNAVSTGQYGPGTSMTSTIDYRPTLFLVNGEPFDPTVSGSNEYPVSQNSRSLLRLLNAGLKSHVPMTVGLRMTLLAEDGSPYPFPRSQYAVLLPAGTAKDAIVVAPNVARYALVDRSMALTNNGTGPGGMMAFLNAAMSAPLTVADDAYETDEEMQLDVVAPGVLGNDAPLAGETVVMVANVPSAAGAVTLDGDGSFVYVPATNFNGSPQFTYQKTNGAQFSDVATVTITVKPVPDAPVGMADAFITEVDTVLNIAAPGVLGNDTDPDGDALQAVPQAAVATVQGGSVTLNADGSFDYTPPAGFVGDDSFDYAVSDGDATTANSIATATISINPPPGNVAPVAVDDQVQVAKGATVDIPVLDNDYDSDGTLDLATVVIVDGPNHGKGLVTVDPVTGVITYTADPNFGGSELFTYAVMDNEGALSNTAKVQVDLVKP